MPTLVEKSITKPATKKNAENQGAMRSPRIWASSWINAKSVPMFSWTPAVEKTSTERATSNTEPMNQKVMSCSWLAIFHQVLQRRLFSSVSGGTYPNDGAATSSPVMGETMLGMVMPIPKPLSLAQLLWARLLAPPAPANATAPSMAVAPISCQYLGRLAAPLGASVMRPAQADASVAMIIANMMKTTMMPTSTIWTFSSKL